MITALPPTRTMLRAFRDKDVAFDGVFYVAVKTTGIFCRPVCRAKPANPDNVEFFPTAERALYHGYRACKLCRPLDSGASPPQLVGKLMSLVDREPARRLRERDLISLGIDPSTARRQFQSYCNMSFAAYQRARRMGVAMRQIRGGSSVTNAQIETGFESGSGFREAFSKLFGASASHSSAVGLLTSTWLPTPLGPMLAVAHDDGIVMLDFVDRKGLELAILRLRHRYTSDRHPATIVPGRHEHLDMLQSELGDYFAGKLSEFRVPLSTRGTEFQMSSWDYLRTIPFGQTRSYQQQAIALGTKGAVRAVGRANGMNYISIVIPCHRVIAANGDLTGYGGGLARKRWLIDHERHFAAS